MNRKILSLLVLMSMLLAMVSSAAASSNIPSTRVQQTDQPSTEQVIARVYYNTREELNTLASRYDILQVDQKQSIAYILLSTDEFTSLQQAGYRLEVDQAKTNWLNQPPLALPGQGPDSIPGFPCYRTVEETFTSMQDIVTSHPDLAEIIDIGDSWDKVTNGGNPGYDILALRLTNENNGNYETRPTFFLMAEIHAREYVTSEAAMRYAEYLISNYGTDPDITWLLDYFKIYIVTMTNPDGRKKAEAENLWRKNVDSDDGCNDPNSWGVDLNRNHTFSWNKGGSSPYACDETYMGPSAGSEPEVEAIESFITTIFPDQRGPGDNDPAPDDTTGLFITLHSFSGLVLWPWGWKSSPAPNGTQLQTLGRHLAYFNGYTPQQSYLLYPTSGTSDEHAYGARGIAGYTFEMGNDFFQDCASFESTIYPTNRDSLLYAFKTARRPYMNPAGPDSLNVAVSPGAVLPGEPVSLTATANDTRYVGGEPTQNIAEARYSIDNPSWITDTVTYPMSASDGGFNSKVENIEATIDTTGLTAGRYTIFVESKDANNNWGVPFSTFLYIVEPGVSPVIEGYVREAGSNYPLDATVNAGLFNTSTDPATGYYSMTVISGTYDLIAEAMGHDPVNVTGIVAHDYQTIPQDFSLNPFCTSFSDDVEGGNLGWTAQSPWAITAEASHSPIHSWTDSPGGPYGDNRNISLTSPIIDLSEVTDVELDFWHTYQTESGYDYGYVEYSTGGAWTNVATYNGSQANWTQVRIPIPALDNQPNARIRFRFSSDYGVTLDGWHIDDIAMTYRGASCNPPAAPVAGFTSNSPVTLGLPVDFTNQSAGSKPLTYNWDFGDGLGSSTDINPSYTYTATGTYTVTLVATNPVDTNTVTHPVTILPVGITSVDLSQVTVGPLLPGVVVDFSADLLPNDAGKPYTYTINFGDGIVHLGISDLDPYLFSHVFTSGGLYSVQISVLNDGMTDPVTDVHNVMVSYWTLLPITVK